MIVTLSRFKSLFLESVVRGNNLRKSRIQNLCLCFFTSVGVNMRLLLQCYKSHNQRKRIKESDLVPDTI